MRQQKRVTRPFFHFTKLKVWDITTMIAYLSLSLLLWQYFKTNGNNETGSVILLYGIFTQLFIYLINYKSLRNASVYLFWLSIGICHLAAYFQLKDNPALQMANGDSATILRNTIPLLLLFQALRFISIRTQRKELVAVAKSPTDFFNERRVTSVDKILTLFYIGFAMILLFIE